MTISREQLHQEACELHAYAEDMHRQFGIAQMVVLLVPAAGHSVLLGLPLGVPPVEALAALVHQTDAAGIVVTGEAWESEPGIRGRTLLDMPFEDLPRPSTDPNAVEAIVTAAAGLGSGGPIKLLRRTRIERLQQGGTNLHPATDLTTSIRSEGLAALLTLALEAGSPAAAVRPSPASEGTVPPADATDINAACPDCQVPIGQSHAEGCCVAWCSQSGRQRRDGCTMDSGCSTGPLHDCRTSWTGLMPGVADCRRLGWYTVSTPNGWVSAAPETPGAVEDVNRLIAQAIWNPTTQRYEAPGDTHPDSPDLPGAHGDLRDAG
ncbi:hypothetical protein [Catenulispora rubra]|uniref:hypothetical protein n=1 Tax=Catenulispora rubra TaxID=280293 RepID=UPI0018921A40|nr:hypothetical protein [Catenulispora rubra]